ncbi:hypothetical protein HID58_084791 [Brassica napus]|uniref:Uncharacterized protein n=1 Tax=Brassica napus TaxID=3708 RepID=A0ABQ7XNH5_BRANA|nr:hypothetical protein HID58_084791 [Brassica napus]
MKRKITEENKRGKEANASFSHRRRRSVSAPRKSRWWWLSLTEILVGLVEEEMSVPLLEEESRSLSATANLGGLTEKISVARLYEQGRRLLLSIIDEQS